MGIQTLEGKETGDNFITAAGFIAQTNGFVIVCITPFLSSSEEE